MVNKYLESNTKISVEKLRRLLGPFTSLEERDEPLKYFNGLLTTNPTPKVADMLSKLEVYDDQLLQGLFKALLTTAKKSGLGDGWENLLKLIKRLYPMKVDYCLGEISELAVDCNLEFLVKALIETKNIRLTDELFSKALERNESIYYQLVESID